jgi:peroxidase
VASHFACLLFVESMANRVEVSGASMAMAVVVTLLEIGVVCGQLEVGFYSDSCPDAEDVVTAAVQDAAGNDPTILPALLRLQFHDCFVKVTRTCKHANDNAF